MNEENKRTVQHDLASGNNYSTYLWGKDVTDKVAATAIKTSNRPNGNFRHFLGCWTIFAINCYIPSSDEGDV